MSDLLDLAAMREMADGCGWRLEELVERYLREALIHRIAPITPHLILCYIAERVLGLPKSY